MEIIKPQNDIRNFKVIILENGIKCVLIQDILLDKSYVITSINIGSLANKEYYDGIAHLLEHMCFITSKKYKETNYLGKKITEYGGDTNAFTAEEFTIYYLDVYHKYLEKILDIFIDFLYNAELKEDYIYNEIKNVDSEHQKNISNDEWRYFNLKHIIADSKSNYNSFFTGSENTLNKLDIRKKIMQFYKKYYIPDNICIGIISNKPIDELCEIATNKLNKIKSNKNTINITYNKFFYKNIRQKAFCMKSNNFTNSISYLFETNNYKYHVDTKIFNILAELINASHDNSLLDHLLNLGYIYTLNAEYNIEGVFEIRIFLTSKGIKNLKKIDGYLRYTFYFYFQQNWTNIIKYYTKEYNFIFNNLEKQDSLDLGITLTQNLSNYSDLSKIYSNNYLITKEISNKKINSIFNKYINFNKCIQIIVKHNFNDNIINTKIERNTDEPTTDEPNTDEPTIEIDPNYNTEYKQVEFIKNKKLAFNIKLNLNNPYLDTKPIYIKNLNEVPFLIKNNIWFGNTSNFIEPHVYCQIVFNNANYFKSPKDTLLTELCINIFNYILNKKLYKAFNLNYSTSLSLLSNRNSIILKLFIYNDLSKMQLFIDNIIDILFNNISISNKLIKIFISKLKINIKNIKNLNAYEYTSYYTNLFYNNSYKYSVLLKEMKEITSEMVKNNLLNIFNNDSNNCSIFIFGNIKKCPEFNKLNKYLSNNNYSLPQLNFKNINTKNPNKNDNNMCIKIMYYIDNVFNALINLHLIFISSIFSSVFYDNLRTIQQVGYIVQFYSSTYHDNKFIIQQIQTAIPLEELLIKINNFNNTINSELLKINLNTWKYTITKSLKEKETNLIELFSHYNKEIITKKFLFDRKKILLEQMDNISIDSLINFCDKYIINNKNKYIIKIYSSK